MAIDPNESRFKRIEGKLRLLIVLASVQSIVIGLLVASLLIKQFMPSTLTMVLFIAAVAGFVYFFRAQIPTWFGSASRFVFAQVFAGQKTDSMKPDKNEF